MSYNLLYSPIIICASLTISSLSLFIFSASSLACFALLIKDPITPIRMDNKIDATLIAPVTPPPANESPCIIFLNPFISLRNITIFLIKLIIAIVFLEVITPTSNQLDIKLTKNGVTMPIHFSQLSRNDLKLSIVFLIKSSYLYPISLITISILSLRLEIIPLRV